MSYLIAFFNAEPFELFHFGSKDNSCHEQKPRILFSVFLYKMVALHLRVSV